MPLKYDFDLNTALDREKISKRSLCDLRESQPKGMPESITDHQLLLFYSACGENVQQSRDAIQKYYKYKRNISSFFSDCDPTSQSVQQCLNNQYFVCLPHTPNNISIIYAGLANSDPNNLFLDNSIKTFLMTIDSCLNSQGPRSGIIFLFNAMNVKLGHLKRFSLKSIATFCNYVQEGLPGKLDEIHIINALWYFESIMHLIRPFLKKDRKIFIHGPSSDYSEVLKSKIPRECLPSDLGGTLESVEELHKQNSERLLKMKNFFADEENQWRLFEGQRVEI